MDELAGCRLVDRAPLDRAPLLRFLRPWGPLADGDELELPRGDGELASRGAQLRLSDAETIAVTGDGRPGLVVAKRGSGAAVTCAFPVETLLATVPDAHRPGDRTWGLYAGVRNLLPVAAGVGCHHPDVAIGELRGPAGGVVTATNHSDDQATTVLRVPGARSIARVTAEGRSTVEVGDDGIGLELEPFAAAVFDWRS
jgi:hypothetical protein